MQSSSQHQNTAEKQFATTNQSTEEKEVQEEKQFSAEEKEAVEENQPVPAPTTRSLLSFACDEWKKYKEKNGIVTGSSRTKKPIEQTSPVSFAD